jgi:hypothetical protein
VRLEPLRHREFRLLFTGQAVSLIGTAIAPIALAFAVLDLHGSASDLGLVLAAAWVPQVLFILFGGVLADRLPRNLVMVGSNCLSGAAQGTAALLLLTGSAKLWHLAALQVVRGIATAFFFPASQGLVPQTVPSDLLQPANALRGLTRNGTQIFGAALGGVAVAATSPGWGLVFDAVTYFASAAILARMRLVAGRLAAQNVLHELKEGWREFRSRQWLWAIVVGAGFSNMALTSGLTVLGPLVAKRSLGGAGPYGVILGAQGVGFVLGGLVSFRVRPRRPMLFGTAALLVTGLPLALFASVRVTLVIAAAAVVGGLGSELFGVLWETALQQHVPLDKLSRVASFDALGSFVLIPLGLSAVGPLAHWIGVTQALWLCAAVVFGSMASCLAVPGVRNLRRPEATVA